LGDHRDQFVAGRGIQRDILARYLGVKPEAIRFRYSPTGKPTLDAPADSLGIRFNVSNSGGLALYALTLAHEVGVDLEAIRPLSDSLGIAQRFFSPWESDTLRALPSAVRNLAFFRCWTRKEAYVKAVGQGLSMPLDQFDVAFRPGEPARLLRIRGDAVGAERWTLFELNPGEVYVGSLAVEGSAWRLVHFDWG
jgi:4'-phosphopantetheinyl transferase